MYRFSRVVPVFALLVVSSTACSRRKAPVVASQPPATSDADAERARREAAEREAAEAAQAQAAAQPTGQGGNGANEQGTEAAQQPAAGQGGES